MNTNRILQTHYDLGHNVGYQAIIIIAKKVLKRFKAPKEFYMAMGTYSFYDKKGDPMFVSDKAGVGLYCGEIDKITGEWDEKFNFTGHPLHITKDGQIDKEY